MKSEKITTAIRMPMEIRKELEAKSAENGRTLSGEIAFRLRKSLEQERVNEQFKQA